MYEWLLKSFQPDKVENNQEPQNVNAIPHCPTQLAHSSLSFFNPSKFL